MKVEFDISETATRASVKLEGVEISSYIRALSFDSRAGDPNLMTLELCPHAVAKAEAEVRRRLMALPSDWEQKAYQLVRDLLSSGIESQEMEELVYEFEHRS